MRRCPKCGRTSEFSERYRFAGEVVPAWVCDNPACRGHDIVRRPGRSIKVATRSLIRESKEIRAKAQRTMMRSRARVKRAEQAIDHSTKLQEQMQPSPSDVTAAVQRSTGVVITDPVSTILTLDETAAHLLNVPARHARVPHLANFFTADRQKLLVTIARVSAGGPAVDLRLTLRPRERRPIPVRVRVAPADSHVRWELTPAD